MAFIPASSLGVTVRDLCGSPLPAGSIRQSSGVGHRMHFSITTHRLWAVGALAGIYAIAACSSASATAHAAAAHAAAKASSPVATRVTVTRNAVAALPQPAPRVVVTRVRTADGSLVTVAVFSGPVRYVLHDGSQDPGPAAAGLVRAGPGRP